MFQQDDVQPYVTGSLFKDKLLFEGLCVLIGSFCILFLLVVMRWY